AFVYENTRALPRVNLYTDWRIADFAELMATGWPDVDPRNIVLLERAPVGAPPPRTGAAAGSARIVRYANTEVVIAVDAPTGGILALNDVWHPWWRAEGDGTAAEVLRADAIFRAVVGPPAMHTARFTFHPLAGAWAELVGKRKDGIESTYGPPRKSLNTMSGALRLWRDGMLRPAHSSTASARLKLMTGSFFQDWPPR